MVGAFEMSQSGWHIYVGEIPYSEKGNFWVSFESNSFLIKTKANIYGKCLPCIQNLYFQLKEGRDEIRLGVAFNCWKIAAVLSGIEECISLLSEFEKRFGRGHVYGKFGSGRPQSEKKVVVFHTEDEKERDRIRESLEVCVPKVDKSGEVRISRACAVLYEEVLGDWRQWKPTTPIKNPEKVGALLERIKGILYWTVM